MKIGFYSPYIPDSSVGGGEKHLFDMAKVLTAEHDVFVLIRKDAVDDLPAIKKKYEDFFNTDLSMIQFIPTVLGTSAHFFKRLMATRDFDYLFYWTDGSLFFSLAATNNLHLQIPFTAEKRGLLERLKLVNWKTKNANSQFTRSVIEQQWRTSVPFVINPMVDVDQFDPNLKKQKVILHVGRFFKQLHAKRQDVLVTAFKRLVDSSSEEELQDWELVLIGTPEDTAYFNEVKKQAKGYNITMIPDASRKELINWYNKASIYWHATGYQVNQEQHPEKVEHFGITTIEAMASGAVPVVINKGGQPEILGAELQENLWGDMAELRNITLNLIRDKKTFHQQRKLARKRAEHFSKEKFAKNVKQMIAKTSM